jgi:Transposase IS66 family
MHTACADARFACLLRQGRLDWELLAQVDALSREVGILSARIGQLEAENATLKVENTTLRGRVAELEAKLGLPAKTPDNSSTPPSRGQKPSGEENKTPATRKAHPGAHRPLHPNPTSRRNVMALSCQNCGADVSAAPSRGKTVVANFLGNWRPDFWVSDCYSGQLAGRRRKTRFVSRIWSATRNTIIDSGDSVFAPDFHHLLGRACRIGRRRDRLADSTLRAYKVKLEKRLDDLMRRAPTYEAGVKLQQVIRKVCRHLFVFMTNRALPPTNNGGERSPRPCVTYREITNGFRTPYGARLYADIRSVVETARRRAIGALDAFRLTLAGMPLIKVARAVTKKTR